NGIEPLAVAFARFDGGKFFLERCQQLGTLVEICGFEIVEVAHLRSSDPSGSLKGQCTTRLITEISFSGSNGLTIQPVPPAALPWSRLSCEVSVVRMRMGSELCWPV